MVWKDVHQILILIIQENEDGVRKVERYSTFIYLLLYLL